MNTDHSRHPSRYRAKVAQREAQATIPTAVEHAPVSFCPHCAARGSDVPLEFHPASETDRCPRCGYYE